ncbi:MAG: hypothetical protein AB1695_09285 [Stygiobacter sp.]
MKRSILFFAILLGLFFVAETANAQTVGNPNKGAKTNWVDANGDGICDNVGTSAQGAGIGKGHGKKDGTGTPMQPKDGTGYGAKNHSANNGNTEGTGTGSGNMMRRGKK